MKKVVKAALVAFCAVAGSACQKADKYVDLTAAQVNSSGVSGEQSGTWSRGSIVRVTGDVVVPEGKSLVIEPGVIVLLDSAAHPEFIVKGNMYSMGTKELPVKFTVEEKYKKNNVWGGIWGGILCGPTSKELVLDYTQLEYGGGVTTEASTSVKQGFYKAKAGENVPAIWTSNTGMQIVVMNSTINNFHDDCTYFEGGKLIFSNNKMYTTGEKGGEGVNIKSGVVADVGYNLFFSNNTNAMKLSNSGDKTPQAHVIGYNNTFVNNGWRRPTIKGGSVWLESGVFAELYNNLFLNTRFGVKQDTKNVADKRTVIANNWYYGNTMDAVNGFIPKKDSKGVYDVLQGTGEYMDMVKAGANDPKLANYPLTTGYMVYTFDPAWDFHLQSASPLLGKGKKDFVLNFKNGLTLNGTNYISPEPADYIGALGTPLIQ